jgi:probable F420-dependent oxidoreductase
VSTTDDARRSGLTIPLFGHALGEHADVIREADELGYTDLWSFETSGIDGFSPLIYAAALGSPARLGTAIVSAYTRGPAVLAMSATAVAQVAPGRFVLGIGSSTEAIVQGWNGVPFVRPVSTVRESIRRMRHALAGERMSLSPDAKGSFRLEAPPPEPIPIYGGALRAGMLRMVGEVADGVVINFLPPSAVPTVLAEVRAGAKAAGRDPSMIDVVCRNMVCIDGLNDETRAVARFILAVYVSSPPYEAFLRWIGMDELIDPMLAKWRAGDRAGALEAMSDELITALLVVGDVDECRARLQEYRDGGVLVPSIAPFSGAADSRASIRNAIRELSPARST